MGSVSRRSVAALLLVSMGAFVLSGCTTGAGGYGIARQTAMDRAIGRCIATVAISAGIGALVGHASGGSDGTGRGALVGAGAGLGLCAVLLEVAASEDRAAIRAAELRALDAGAARTESFRARSGKSVEVRTSVEAAPVPKRAKPARPAVPKSAAPKSAARTTPEATEREAAPAAESTEVASAFTDCRFSNQTVSVDGQAASSGQQLWCRKGTGDWQPIQS